MSRHQIYCDGNYELTIGLQFSNMTFYAQMLGSIEEGYSTEEVLEDIDIEAPLVNDDRKDEEYRIKYAELMEATTQIFKDYLSTKDYDSWRSADKTALFEHMLRERRDRALCNQVYKWNIVGKHRQQFLKKAEKELVE